MKRYIESHIATDLKKKMVFIGGPRQVGKTTLSKQLCEHSYPNSEYYNWDLAEDRQTILKKAWLPTSPVIIFDELHKYPSWKRWIKGIYDTKRPNQQFLVTGSARLDVYRKGGDSLLDRYHYWRLHPLTLDEIPTQLTAEQTLKRLITVGGFPEPFFTNNEREAQRWHRERFDRILREDVRDLQEIQNLQKLQLFVDRLRYRGGQLITLANLARDLEIAPKTAKNWLILCENMYIAFAIYPLTTKIPQAIQKPPKVYFYDNADLLNDAMMAHVLKI